MGKPAVTVDYVSQVNRMVRPTADESLNAEPFYVKAAQIYEKLAPGKNDSLGKKYDEVSDEEKLLIKELLNENKGALDSVIAGSKKPFY